ncbi:TPM domain-containing protein [Anabaenopsis tanganyikae CS-531]|uniref:TPM domain-containing protein n=2 Tax=Anabaenopsis TaxID=110103 RepID=A0ABT6KDZ8_9CYAN|nr:MULTISPECIES: TPM domain-containing protein [Anabaenopsis]MDB9540299.1 TPM domain-containing protein [Anabaenopsis arnoldii]MDH6092697.1 TPM domain-containing protein [Anabaenopsis arnoldii]MDH6105976.1 TPM domain-containing protein [Anabaenopsis tanganyikae CS-531]
MQSCFWRRTLVCIAAFFLAGSMWVMHSPPALAYDNPDLLPNYQTPVIDLAKSLTDIQEAELVTDLEKFEGETGWKLRVLTQYDRTPGRAVINYWNLDDKSILLVADSRGGNILSFSVGDEVYELLPRTFWIELQTRFGNLYFVREEGEDQAILQALNSVKGCLVKGGCSVVPGLPREQWILTLITSVVGGIVCGFAAHPQKKGQIIAWQWALIFSPLWGILFIAFGIGPVVTRTSDWLPLVRNISGFLIGALVAYLSPGFTRSSNAES